MSDMLICVDAMDRQIGTAEKLRCHKDGLLHRAFSVFLVDGDRMLLQRRALSKYHSGGKWANSCCSHPRDGESLEEAVPRRLKEELGLECRCEEVGSFVYRHWFENGLTEYEYDHVFVGRYTGEVFPAPEEIMDTKWFEIKDILSLMNDRADMFAPWFITAFPLVLKQLKYPGTGLL